MLVDILERESEKASPAERARIDRLVVAHAIVMWAIAIGRMHGRA